MARKLYRRRRRRIVVRRVAPALVLAGVAAIVVVLLLGAASQIAPASSTYRQDVNRGFAALANPLALQSNALSGQVGDIVANGPSSDRPQLFAQLNFLASSAARLARRFGQITPPDVSGTTGTDCVEAMNGRSQAVASFQQAVERLLGGPTGDAPGAGDQSAAGQTLSSVTAGVRSSDAAWSRCRATLGRAPGNARLLSSSWAGDSSVWSSGTLSGFVSAVAGSSSLAANHGLGIASAITVPAPLPGSGTGFVVPPTSSLGMNVVVQDGGNVDEPHTAVTVSLTPNGGTGNSSATVSRTVDTAVSAGGSAAILVAGVAVSPGTSYALQVTATSPGVAAQPLQESLQVQQAVSSTVLAPSSSTVAEGRGVIYTAIVSTSVRGIPPATGTVAFQQDGAPIASCGAQPLRHGLATCSVVYRGTGTHSITAAYSGNAIWSSSTSLPFAQKVVR